MDIGCYEGYDLSHLRIIRNIRYTGEDTHIYFTTHFYLVRKDGMAKKWVSIINAISQTLRLNSSCEQRVYRVFNRATCSLLGRGQVRSLTPFLRIQEQLTLPLGVCKSLSPHFALDQAFRVFFSLLPSGCELRKRIRLILTNTKEFSFSPRVWV